MPEVVSISAQSHRGGTSPRTTARLLVKTESVSQSLDQLHVSVGLDIFHLTSRPPIHTAKEEGDVEDEREREGLSRLWSHPAIVKEAKQKRPPKNGTRSDSRLKNVSWNYALSAPGASVCTELSHPRPVSLTPGADPGPTA